MSFGADVFVEVATDVGGTFTDVVCYRGGPEGAALTFGKVHTTPPRFDEGVVAALAASNVDGATMTLFVHGSTVVINALTERRGVRVGLVTTRGFRDVLLIGRANRPDLYDIQFTKPHPFVRRRDCGELTERMDADGGVVTQPALEELPGLLDRFRRNGVEAIGVCLLHSYANPAHEEAVASAIRAAWPEVAVVASHEICREWREYERTSTTVLSAYVKPAVGRYLERLESRLGRDGFAGHAYLVQSNGGLARFDAGREDPISLVESGPAAGMFGAMAWGRTIGRPDLLALDIGGTTAKCTLIEGGQVRLVTDYRIERTRKSAGHPIRTPVVDIVEIGTGGGSIAAVDMAGRLQVGPRSAGAVPGPIAYGKGGAEPTTTDANLWTGRIGADGFAGGDGGPDLGAVGAAFGRMGEALGTDRDSAARGVLRVANANMVNALKLVTVNRGRDPQAVPLIAFGGGGPLHAAFLAAELHMSTVIIPPHPAVFSAWGMLLSDARRDSFRTLVLPLDGDGLRRIEAVFRGLEEEVEGDLAAEREVGVPLRLGRSLEMRYQGQEHSLRVPCEAHELGAPGTPGRLAEVFHAAHEQEFTFRLDAAIVVVGLHLAASVPSTRRPLSVFGPEAGPAEAAVLSRRTVDFDGFGQHTATVYARERLAAGETVSGPAVVQEANTGTVLPPGFRLTVDAHGNLVVDCPAGGPA